MSARGEDLRHPFFSPIGDICKQPGGKVCCPGLLVGRLFVLCVSQVAQRQFALSHGGSSWAAGWEASAASTGAAVQTPI